MHTDKPISDQTVALYNELAKRLTGHIGKPVEVVAEKTPRLYRGELVPDEFNYHMTLMCDGLDLASGCNVREYNAARHTTWGKTPDPVWKLEIHTYSRDHGNRSFPELKGGGYSWDKICERVGRYFQLAAWERERTAAKSSNRERIKQADLGKWTPRGMSGHVRIAETMDTAKPVKLDIRLEFSGTIEGAKMMLDALKAAGLIHATE